MLRLFVIIIPITSVTSLGINCLKMTFISINKQLVVNLNLILDHSLLLCDNVNCKDSSHVNAKYCLYIDTTEALLMSSQEFVKNIVIRKEYHIVGWTEYCSASHAEARATLIHWATCSKPCYGPIFEHIKRTRPYSTNFSYS